MVGPAPHATMLAAAIDGISSSFSYMAQNLLLLD
jgi:hypothetical protein